MKYVIDVYKDKTRVATTTDPLLREVLKDRSSATVEQLFHDGHYLSVTREGAKDYQMFESDAYETWIEGLQRAAVWLQKPETAVNPNHYRGMLEGMPDLGWLDIESRKEKYRNPEVFLGAVDLQENKYMERLGKKDDPLQERKKSLFYKVYAILYMENGCKPIKADLVHEWMAKMPEMPGHCL